MKSTCRSVLLLALLLLGRAASPQDGRPGAALEREALRSSARGDFARAVELLEKVLAQRERRLGPRDPLVGRTLYNLSYALSRLGRHDQALRAGRRALDAARRQGDPSRATAFCRRNLAEICEKAGLFREARELAERAVADFEKVDGKSLDAARAREYAGRLAFQAGEPAAALEHWAWTLAVYERLLGGRLPRTTGRVMVDLARVLERLGKPDAALALLDRALAGVGEPGDPFWVGAARERAFLLDALGERAAARDALVELAGKDPSRDAFLASFEDLSALGEAARARRLLDSWKDSPQKKEGWLPLFFQARVSAGLGRWREALDAAGGALRSWREEETGEGRIPPLELVLLRARALWNLGRPHQAEEALFPVMNAARERWGEDLWSLAPLFLALAEAERRARGATPELLDFLEMAEACLARGGAEMLWGILEKEDRFVGREGWGSLEAGWIEIGRKGPKRFARAFRALDRLRERSLLSGLFPWMGRWVEKNPSLRNYMDLLARERKMEFTGEARRRSRRLFREAEEALRKAAPFWAELLLPEGADPEEVGRVLGGKGLLVRFLRAGGEWWALTAGASPGERRAWDLGREAWIDGMLDRLLQGESKAAPALGGALFGPLSGLLRGKETLVVVPEGRLALLDLEDPAGRGGRSLVPVKRVIYAVSARAWLQAARRKAGPSSGGALQAVFGGGRKGWEGLFPRTARVAARFFSGGGGGWAGSLPQGGKGAFRGESGFRQAVRSGQAGVLHLRMPLLLNGESPPGICFWAGPGKRSCEVPLWERPDGIVTPGEILEGALKGAQVVLGEIRRDPSGRRGDTEGLGFLSLVRAFAGAGAGGLSLRAGGKGFRLWVCGGSSL